MINQSFNQLICLKFEEQMFHSVDASRNKFVVGFFNMKKIFDFCKVYGKMFKVQQVAVVKISYS